MSVRCDYCQREADLVTGADIYPHLPELHAKEFWRCRPCGAYVGCHAGTRNPLGRLANAELRLAKVAAHAAFDLFWRSRGWGRNAAYRWLSDRLGIPRAQCHIGMFDVETCARVVAMCEPQEQSA